MINTKRQKNALFIFWISETTSNGTYTIYKAKAGLDGVEVNRPGPDGVEVEG